MGLRSSSSVSIDNKYKLTSKLKKSVDRLSKYRIDLFLLSIRVVVLLLWGTILLTKQQFGNGVQIVFAGIIFLSDAFDGIFSRRFVPKPSQYTFRMADSFVDKMGILLFLIILLQLHDLPLSTAIIIVTYNIILVLPPVLKIVSGRRGSYGWIQATFWSRFYAFSVGIYFLSAIMTEIPIKHEVFFSYYFVVIGIFSLLSHLIKIQNLEEVNNV